MKSIKMALTAAAIFAVVGGALAFKTTKAIDGTIFCNLGATEAAPCENTELKYTLVGSGQGSPAFCSTSLSSTVCDQERPNVIEDAK